MANTFDFASPDSFGALDLTMFPVVEDFDPDKTIATNDTDAEDKTKSPKVSKKTAAPEVVDDFENKILKLESEKRAKGEKIDIEEEEDIDKPNTEFKNKSTIFQTLAEDFAKKGLLTIQEDFDGSEESFINSFRSTLDSKFDEMIDDYTNSLPEEGKALLQHLTNGGKVSDFSNVYSQSLDDVDLNNSEDRKKILTRYYEEIVSMPKSKISSKVDKLMEMGLDGDDTEGDALDALERLKAKDAENKLALDNNTRAMRRQDDEDRQSTINSVRDFIAKNDTIKGVLPIKDPKTKKEFEDYLLKPAVKLRSGQVVTRNVADALSEQGDTEVILFSAYNRFKKYNTDSIQKKGATAAIESLAEKLERSGNNIKTKNIEEDFSSNKKKNLISDWEEAIKYHK